MEMRLVAKSDSRFDGEWQIGFDFKIGGQTEAFGSLDLSTDFFDAICLGRKHIGVPSRKVAVDAELSAEPFDLVYPVLIGGSERCSDLSPVPSDEAVIDEVML